MVISEEQFDRKWGKKFNDYVKNSHSEPSPETKERLAILETNQNNMMEKLEEINSTNKDEHKQIIGMIADIKKSLDTALEKKADKETQWAERVWIWVGGIIGLGLFGTIGTLIVKAIIHFN